METLTLELIVTLTTLDDTALPDQARLIEQLMDYMCSYHNKAGVLAQSVQLTAIDGEQVS